MSKMSKRQLKWRPTIAKVSGGTEKDRRKIREILVEAEIRKMTERQLVDRVGRLAIEYAILNDQTRAKGRYPWGATSDRSSLLEEDYRAMNRERLRVRKLLREGIKELMVRGVLKNDVRWVTYEEAAESRRVAKERKEERRRKREEQAQPVETFVFFADDADHEHEFQKVRVAS